MSAEAYSKHGLNIHGVVFDELHTQPNRKLFNVMQRGQEMPELNPKSQIVQLSASIGLNPVLYRRLFIEYYTYLVNLFPETAKITTSSI